MTHDLFLQDLDYAQEDIEKAARAVRAAARNRMEITEVDHVFIKNLVDALDNIKRDLEEMK